MTLVQEGIRYVLLRNGHRTIVTTPPSILVLGFDLLDLLPKQHSYTLTTVLIRLDDELRTMSLVASCMLW